MQSLTTHRKPFQSKVSFFDYVVVVVVVYIYFQTVIKDSTSSNLVGSSLGETGAYYACLTFTGRLSPGGVFIPFIKIKLYKRVDITRTRLYQRVAGVSVI